MKDEHTSKRKASFLPDRKNKYSIRKFTVGTASILVGASLLFGLDTQDAQAAEQSTTSTENAATPNKDTKVEVNHADAVVNETANSTSSEVVKTDDVKETLKAIVEAPQPTESKASTEKTTSDDQVVVKETSQKAEVVTSNQQESKQQVVSAEKATLENKAEVQQAVEAPKVEVPTSTLEIQQVQDLNTAAEFYAQSSGVSIEDAQALIQELNLDSNATPEEIQQALIYQLSHEYDVWFKPAVREGLTTEAEHVAGSPDIVKYADTLPNDPEVIEADAIKNGYVRSGSDEINKANLISGRAWITSTGTLATGSNGMLPVPVNTPVFLQWKDQDGSVSPIYVAYTHNNKSDDAAQDGPGAYAFDLRKGWTDATGKQHLYTAHEGQEYRFWIEDFKTPEGNTATMLRQAGGYFPGAFVNTFTGSNLGQVPVVGKNVSRTGIYMSVIPSAHYMTKDANQWSTSNASPGDPGILAVDGMNSVRGKVWLESSGGDKANSATGPVFNPNFGDKVASNYHVVFSTLTAAGASAYRQQVESLPTNQRPAAAKRLLSQHPEYIASTVQTTTDSRGAYAIKFPTGMQMDYLYGFVTDPKGNLVQAYSAYTSPEFRRPNSAPSISPQAIPYPGLQQWANVNFAVVTSPSQAPKLDITNFNTTTQPASPGSKALIKLDGKTIPALPTHIVWTNGAGQVVHTTKDFYTIKEGEKLGAFTIPSGAKDGEIYTALLVSGDNVISGDSLIVRKIQPQKDKYEPTTGEITKPFGTPTTEQEVKDKVTVPKFPTTGPQPTFTVDTTKIPDGQTTGEFQVPVTVTYPDGTKDHVNVKVTVGPKDSDTYEPTTGEITKPFGTPTTEQEVKDKVTVPNFPADKGTPTVTVDDPTKVPDGQTPGVYDVPVTVTYPDKTTDKVNVKVTVGEQPQKDKYEPTTGEITKPFGTPTTPDEVKGKVTVPDFPKTGDQPVITVDDPTKVPDGQTPGVFDVPVTVTYPDKTTDKVTVKVTVGDQADNAKYEPTTGEITKPFGTPTTEQEVKEKVTVPNFPKTGDQPVFTVDTTKIPDGQTTGEFQVPVTVTYPDKTTDTVNVKVTVGPKDSETYEPTTGEITKPFGTPTTPDEVKGKVTVPNFPTTGDQPVITVDDPTKVPDGQTTGVFDVPVTVTYPDKTTDKVTVKVTVGEQADNAKYEPTTGEITKPFGTPTTEQEVKDKVTVPNFPADKGTPVVTVDDPTKVPDGQTPGVFDVPVTVTYPDKTTDKVTVKVTVGDQADNAKYEPTTGEITKPFGTPTTEQEVKDKVTVPNFPATGDQPTITVDDPTKVPDGQTPGVFDVPVTVIYPDKTTDKVTVKVTVGEQPQKDKYEPTTGEITKPFGTPTTEQEVKDKVTVPNFPADKGTPVVTVDDPTKVPDGQTTGVFDVPVTVTYPDKTTDKVTVKVTVGDQADNAKYEPTTGEITKPFGTPTTEDEVKGKVKVPNFPTTGDQPVLTVDTTKVPNGQTSGEFEVPVTVTYPDKTTDTVNVKVTVGPKDSDTYEPTFENITKPFGTPTTEQEVKDKVKVPNFPADKGTPVVTVDDPTKVPDGQTTGVFDVPVTVTYPDGSTDKVTVKVTVGEQPDNAKYDPKAGEITKHYGETTTPNEVKDKVTVPGYPENGQPYTVTVDETKIPDGQTSGEFEVPVTVTYPDKTTDTVNVKVTVGPKDSDTYEPTTEPITKPFGTPTTEQEVKDKVKVPNFPADKGTPVVTVDDPTKVPDGQTPGEYDVPVTVTYPDGTKDHVNVKVTVGPKDSDTYEPTTEPITKPYGQGTTEQEVKDKVKVPNFPADKGTPVVTVDDPTKVPDGQTPGEYDVPVTVTYPDGTKDHVNVKVTVNPQPQNDKYEPTTGEITKPYGSTTTEDEVKDKVSIPDFPKEGDQPVITVDTTKIPDGQTSGEFEVPVTVTYPDKTTDKVTVKVTVGPKDSDTYEPTTEPITKPYGQGTTEQEVKDKVKVPNFPVDKGTPVVTVDDPTKVPDGQTPGEYDVPVTVTYPDGTKDHVNVKVTVGPKDSDTYEPTTEPITKPYGQGTTEQEVKDKVKVPNFPTDKGTPVVTVDDPTKVPDGQTPGVFDVPVTVTYPDGTKDHVTVKVTVDPQPQNDKYEPIAEPITKPFGTPTTEDEVKGNVSIPDFPKEGDQPVITVDDSTKVPNGQTPGVFDVPVTVTYPDGTEDHVTVKVTVNPQPENDKYEPVSKDIEKPYNQPTTENEVVNQVTVPDYPTTGDQPKVTVDDPTLIPDGKVPGEYDVPVTVTYPDGTKDHVTVKVTVGPKDSDVFEPVTETVEKPYGTPTTIDDVVSKVTVPGYSKVDDPYKVTVDDPSELPNGQTPGEYDVTVTVTYPDGSTDHVVVKVVVGPKDSDTYEPTTEPIEKPFGTPTTIDEVVGKVTVPGYPENEKPYTVTVDDPSLIPSGSIPGTYDVPVTVTYPDGTKDHVNVTITVDPQPDADIYNPGYNDVEVNPGESIEIPQVKDEVPTGTRFEIPEESGVDKDWTVTVDPDTGKVTVTAPKDAVEGDVVTVTVQVTYPDGSTENVTVNVTVHDSIAPEAPVVNPIEAGDRIVTGTGKEPGTTVTVTFPDGSTVSTKVDKDGNWKADVPSTVTLKVGDTVKAVITDEAGNVSEETAAPVKDTVAPDAPVVNGIHTGDKVITGTAEPGTTVTVTFPNGTTVSVKVGQDGTWSVDVPSGVTLRTGDKVTAVAIDDAGNVSKSTTAIVVGDKEGTPSPNEGKTKVSTDRTTNHTHNNNQSTKVEVSKAKDTDSNKAAKKAKSTAKALPNTGEETTNSGVLFGGLFAALGSILLFRKRRNHDDNK